jgi:SWI/SNF-related matrix-associated actin-dependent regulator 1 of chromatin subfamily A
MGLGKTIQAIAIACCYSSEWPLLVICPSILKINWSKEFEKWIPKLARKGSGWSDINVIKTTKERLE